MPTSADDPVFGGERGSAAKAYAAIIKTYGPVKGERVYNALRNKRRRQKGLVGATKHNARR